MIPIRRIQAKKVSRRPSLPVDFPMMEDGRDDPMVTEFPPQMSNEKQRGGKGKPVVKADGKRRGKWALEEEEYVSSLILYFDRGLLHLKEGTTLRSYLAERLNCDPMRITKKFAGAGQLGKRVRACCQNLSKGCLTPLFFSFFF